MSFKCNLVPPAAFSGVGIRVGSDIPKRYQWWLDDTNLDNEAGYSPQE
jgi:hypothetical protein